jgi:DNA-directed RNA polymerase specialized sigma24 family protein
METNHWARLRSLADDVMERGDDSWPPFWLSLSPHLERWVRQPNFLGRVSQREDYCSDIVLITWEKLQQNDYNKMRAYFRRESHSGADPSGGRFKSWMYRVFKNIGIDYMRSLPEYVRGGRHGGGEQTAPATSSSKAASEVYWQSIVTLQSQAFAIRDPVTLETTARRMLDFLDNSIPRRQAAAVELKAQGLGSEEIARELGLRDADEAERVIARSRERLKYRQAVELWSQGFSDTEIARRLELSDARHAYRLVNAAKELLKRHFRP